MDNPSDVINTLEMELRSGLVNIQNRDRLNNIIQSQPNEFLDCLLESTAKNEQLRPYQSVGNQIWRISIKNLRAQNRPDLVETAYSELYRLEHKAKYQINSLAHGLLDTIGVILSLGSYEFGEWLSGKFYSRYVSKITKRYDCLLGVKGLT